MRPTSSDRGQRDGGADRAGAAATFVERVRASNASGALAELVVVVLEGPARAGAPEGVEDGVEVVHARGSGDDALVARAASPGGTVVLVTADRELADRARQVGADVNGPSWLLRRLVD